MLGTFGNLISCFVHERKHRLVKRYSGSVQNTSVAYEHGVLAEITGQQLEDMADPEFWSSRIGLINPRRPSRRLQEQLEYEFPGADLAAARAARFSCFGVCCVGDVVLFSRHGGVAAGYVVFHASVDGERSSLACNCSIYWDRALAVLLRGGSPQIRICLSRPARSWIHRFGRVGMPL